MLKSTDPLRGPSRGDVEWALGRVENLPMVSRLDELKDFVRELYHLAQIVELDAAILLAVSALETASWSSEPWTTNLNPADSIVDEFDLGLAYRDGKEAARALLVRVYRYVYGPIPRDHVLAPYVMLNPRSTAAFAMEWDGHVAWLHDLTGKWAPDPNYHDKLMQWAATYLPDLQDVVLPEPKLDDKPVFGLVPHPPYQSRIIDKPLGAGWNDRGPRNIVGTCVHTMQGTLMGTDRFFRNRNDKGWRKLTDYGIGGAPEVANGHHELDGVIYLWNDPRSRRTPWASSWGEEGPGVEGHGQAFIDAYGTPAINRDLVSIELSGFYVDQWSPRETVPTPKQLESLCRLVAYWHDQARVPSDAFPVNPRSGVVTQLQHYEFAKKACPGPKVRGLTETYWTRVREILRQYQLGGGFAEPVPPPPWDGTDKLLNKVTFHAVPRNRQRVHAAIDGLACLKWATVSAPPVRAPLSQGEEFAAVYWIKSDPIDENPVWWVTQEGARISCSGTVEQP
jgi:hypothetical protein